MPKKNDKIRQREEKLEIAIDCMAYRDALSRTLRVPRTAGLTSWFSGSVLCSANGDAVCITYVQSLRHSEFIWTKPFEKKEKCFIDFFTCEKRKEEMRKEEIG